MQAYHDEGHGFVECAKKFDFGHTAWVKAIKSGRLRSKATPFRDRGQKYDWAKIQAYVNAGFTYRECLIRFGFEPSTWANALKRGAITARSRALPIDVMFARKMSRGSIKRRLIELEILNERCSRCEITEWRGKPLTLHLDHVNGATRDWRLENLRMLCPNCHSQTPTFSARNLKN
ncbi:MAG TPA: HNH endonuclease signature motif containing protein, partial [Candidatus Baltobacteraceae bacterium]|nr:HNH endonuclease signature motif containing protein [Candidatus Baltobacteraceae bacterium]